MIHEGVHSKAFTKPQIPNTIFISQGLSENPLGRGGGGDWWMTGWASRLTYGRQPAGEVAEAQRLSCSWAWRLRPGGQAGIGVQRPWRGCPPLKWSGCCRGARPARPCAGQSRGRRPAGTPAFPPRCHPPAGPACRDRGRSDSAHPGPPCCSQRGGKRERATPARPSNMEITSYVQELWIKNGNNN